MNDLKIGAQLFAFRDYLIGKSECEISEFLERIKSMGYDAIQISGIGKIDSKAAGIYKRVCEKLGLEICATHVSLGELGNDLDWIIKYHRMWGCSHLGVGSIPDQERNLNGALAFAKKYNSIGEKLNAAGLSLFYHNHLFEFQKYGGTTLMDILFDEFDERYVEFELDTYFVQAGGANPVDWIYKTDDRMSVIHLKDMAVTDGRAHIAALGDGNLCWEKIIKACRETKVKYAVVELHQDMQDPVGALKTSIDYLKKIIL